MPTFTLHRDHPLTEAEWTRLPNGCSPLSDGTDVVARADVDGPVLDLLVFTAGLARAVPDARLMIRVPAAVIDLESAPVPTLTPVQTLPEAQTEQPLPPVPSEGPTMAAQVIGAPSDPALLREDPWAMVDAGDWARAERRFALGYELDMMGRDRVREIYNSTDPALCALGCRLAGYTNWKSFVTTLRRAIDHADVRVRRDAVTAIGKLAGPAMLPAIEDKLKDPSPEVVAAAKEAVARLHAKEPSGPRRR